MLTIRSLVEAQHLETNNTGVLGRRLLQLLGVPMFVTN